MKDESVTIKFNSLEDLLEFVGKLSKRSKIEFYVKTSKYSYFNAIKK